jgi:membrane associated rhomboid family serine protease
MNLVRMLLPLRVVGKHDFRAYMTFAIMCAYFAVFVWEIALTLQGGQPIEQYLEAYALATCEIGRVPAQEIVLDSVRALFMTTSFVTLMINMLFLWIFGPLVERFLGARRYLTFFLLTGLAGYLVSYLLRGGCYVMVGPNSAISGVIAGFVFLYPAKRIETVLRPILDRRLDFPALAFGFVYLALQFLAEGGGPLSGTFAPVWDEIGGFAAGLVGMFVITLFRPAPKVDPFDYLDE